MDKITYLPDLNLISSLVESLGQDYSNEVIENKYRSNNTKKKYSKPTVSRVADSQEYIQNNVEESENLPLNITTSKFEKQSENITSDNAINHCDIIDLTDDVLMKKEFNGVKECNENFSTRIISNSNCKNFYLRPRSMKKSKNVAISSIMKQKEDNLNEKNTDSLAKKNTDDHLKPSDIPMDISKSGKNTPCSISLSLKFDTCSEENRKRAVKKIEDTCNIEVNSMDKVKLWLYSDTNQNKYGEQLSKMQPREIPSKPVKFTSNLKTNRLYQELMKTKPKLPVSNQRPSKNDLWDYIEQKMG